VKKIPDILTNGPLGTLWKGRTVPLLKPSEAISTAAIYSKISVKKIAENPSLIPIIKVEDKNKLKIAFDLYGPNVQFKKSAPRLPNFRIVVVKADESVPTKSDLKATLGHGKIKDKVPLLFAIVSHSDIAFYSMYPVDLPTQITMG
jgi:tRNA-splicing endonuclease subunit Sen54